MNTNEVNGAGWKYTERKVINIVKEMEPIMAEHGFHLAAGGSCIYRGGSNKDMDIIAYPHKGDVPGGVSCLPLVAPHIISETRITSLQSIRSVY